MSTTAELDHVLITRIRRGEAEAWNDLIARYEGRLLAFVESRLQQRSAAEDIVQETFIGFLTSLPNYDESRSLESYLFSIAAHKLTDHLRREGRRPVVPLAAASSDSQWNLPSPQRAASSLLRSGERKRLEETALVNVLREQFDRWRQRGDWEKLKCMELLFVRGWANKDAAAALGISEQAVANHKFDFLAKLRAAVKNQNLPEEVFPELKD
jgi:RNA polymerase sigma-70 factor (ECF subfamily)